MEPDPMIVCPEEVFAGNHPELGAILAKIADDDSFELPVLPEVAAQLLQLTNDIDCDPPESLSHRSDSMQRWKRPDVARTY